MKRALALLLLLLSTAASSADLTPTTRLARESSSQKPQWAPSGNFSALHRRAVFPSETRSSAGSYAREQLETAAAKSVWSYANLNPSRYTDPDGREGIPDLVRGCVQGFNDDTGLRRSEYGPGGAGVEPGPCPGALPGDTIQTCQIPAVPKDPDARRGFAACRPSALFKPPDGLKALDDRNHAAMYASEVGTNTRDWWYSGETSRQVVGAVFGAACGATGMPLPNGMPADAQAEANRVCASVAATIGVATLGEGALSLRNLKLPPPTPFALAGGGVSVGSAAEIGSAASSVGVGSVYMARAGTYKGKPISPSNPNYGSGTGRRGSFETRRDIDRVRDEFLDANPDYEHVGGGTKRETGQKIPEEYLRPRNGGREGGAYADLTFEHRVTRERIRINTVDVKPGGWMTEREQENFFRIWDLTQETVIALPKPPPGVKLPVGARVAP